MNQLRYIDLDEKEPKIYYFENEQFTPVTDINNEANHITQHGHWRRWRWLCIEQ